MSNFDRLVRFIVVLLLISILYVGEFKDFTSDYNSENIFYKEHPLNKNYKGVELPRDWMFTVQGYFPSFFSFWKKCKKELVY